MRDKYTKHIQGDVVPEGYYVCNVVICKSCKAEFLLGQRCSTCWPQLGASYKLRKHPTILKSRESNDIGVL